jgi:hypothetical protein
MSSEQKPTCLLSTIFSVLLMAASSSVMAQAGTGGSAGGGPGAAGGTGPGAGGTSDHGSINSSSGSPSESGSSSYFLDMDSNRDGVVSREEYLNYSSKQYDQADKSHRDALTEDQMKTLIEK